MEILLDDIKQCIVGNNFIVTYEEWSNLWINIRKIQYPYLIAPKLKSKFSMSFLKAEKDKHILHILYKLLMLN